MTLEQAEQQAQELLARSPLPKHWAGMLEAIEAQLEPMDRDLFAQYYEAGFLLSDGT